MENSEKQKTEKQKSERYDPKEVEPRIQKFWEEQKIFAFDKNSKKPVFSIDTPPPTISGMIHMGHAMSYSQAEFVARFWRMMGCNVFYPMGFDDNGLPTERYVEKKLNIRANTMPRQDFVKLCLQETKKGEEEFRKVWKELGISVDWSLLYSTINPLSQRISQKSFLELYNKKRIYRAEAPVTWCPLCQTAVAQAELEDSEKESFFNYIKFDVGKDSITIATTRPELMPACVAIFVHPDDERYKKIIGKKARLPFFNREVQIYENESVDMEFGTGAVYHCTFGDADDIEWVRKYNLPIIKVMNSNGTLNENAGKYQGLKVEEARKQIIEDLKKEGRVEKQESIKHVVNVHERCGTPVEFLMSVQWFIKILDMKEKFLELGSQITWHPSHMKVRYDQWVQGLNADWLISRQRFFGVPFPVWFCKKCGNVILADESDLPVDPLHSKPKKKCSCGSSEFEPEKDVMDTWATSSVTPLINGKWKEKNSIMKKIYPMSLRPQAHDIIRTWTFYTIAKCYMHTNQIPWNTVMVSGHGLDPHGKKMSKSKGNIVEPLPVKEKYSADAVRFWSSSANLGEDFPYQEKDVATGQKLLTKLWNASKLAGPNLSDKKPKELEIMDKWLLSKLAKLVKYSTEHFKICEYGRAKTETEIFFWREFADNYLEMVKYRLYEGGDDSAKYTLYTALLTLLKLFAPIIPHITEELYRIYFRKTEKDVSIHISNWPEFDGKLVDEKAEEIGELAKQIISALRQYKSSRKLALNTELKKIVIDCDNETRKNIEQVEPDIKGTMKVKELGYGKADEISVSEKIRMNVVQ